jgi:hypothetical protein
MAALAADASVNIDAHGNGMPLSVKVIASDIIYKGALCCVLAADGFLKPCAASLTNPEFMGIAMEQVDNSAGAEGALGGRILRRCEIEVSAIVGASEENDIGTAVYAVTDNPEEMSTASTNNVLAGKITYYDSDRSVFRVLLEAESVRSN